jgi:hypothetical protein
MRTNIQIGEPVDYTPRPAGQPGGDPLVDLTMREVDRFFRERTNHRPSRKMLEALEDIPRTVSKIVRGQAQQKYYLCSLDTGLGKSITLAQTIRTLRKPSMSWSDGDQGTVICVGRYTQVEAMVRDMGLHEDEYAVLVADGRPELEWGLGSGKINQAPVLLTTHAMVMKRLQKMSPRTHNNSGFNDDISAPNKPEPGSWAFLSEFYYAGKPRVLRVWDEAILPGVPLILKARDLDGILWAF